MANHGHILVRGRPYMLLLTPMTRAGVASSAAIPAAAASQLSEAEALAAAAVRSEVVASASAAASAAAAAVSTAAPAVSTASPAIPAPAATATASIASVGGGVPGVSSLSAMDTAEDAPVSVSLSVPVSVPMTQPAVGAALQVRAEPTRATAQHAAHQGPNGVSAGGVPGFGLGAALPATTASGQGVNAMLGFDLDAALLAAQVLRS